MNALAQDCHAAIAALRAAGAEQVDPLRLHYLEALSARAQAQPDGVKQILETRLAQALADLQQRLTQAQAPCLVEPPPVASASATEPASTTPQAETLSDLLRSMATPAAQQADSHGAVTAMGPRSELKAVSQFRATWSRLSADKQVAEALDLAPQNAGPINSHMLVLRSLALMREIAPDYLSRFISYTDTLLCLDAAEQERQAPSKPGADSEAGKKTRAKRARS